MKTLALLMLASVARIETNQGEGIHDGGTAWPVSGPLTDTQLRASAVPVSGTLSCNAGSGTLAVSLATAPSTPVTGTFWQSTQPVSISGSQAVTTSVAPVQDGGMVNVGNWPATNACTQSGTWSSVGVTGTFFQASQPVTIPINPVADGGMVNVGNFPASYAVTGTFYQASQPVTVPINPVADGGMVNVGNWPSSQACTVPINPVADGGMVNVGNFPSSQAVTVPINPVADGGMVNVGNWPASFPGAVTIPINPVADGGMVNVGNFPATQTVNQATGTNLHVVTDVTSVLAANQSVNVSQMNAVTVLMGTGATGTGSQRVTLATNSPGFSTSGGTLAVDSALTAGKASTYGSSPTAIAAGTQAPDVSDLEGRKYVNIGHPRAISCVLTTTATSSTQITGCEVVTSNSIYVTGMGLCGDIANATATPAILQSGTSTACTGPHILWSGYHPALSCINMTFNPPIKATVAEGLCILDGTTGTKKANITAYVAP